MSFLCVRVDLDYVPWDTPDADRFGHGEPAMLIRLLEWARRTGLRLHFFASERTLRAFPTEADAVLNDGHDLDYLAKHPADSARIEEADRLFAKAGHVVRGWAVREVWPPGLPVPSGLEFVSGPPGGEAPVRTFPADGKSLHDAIRAGDSLRTWLDGIVSSSTRTEGTTAVLSPQVLARVDPRLTGLSELLAQAREKGVPVRTLREETDRRPIPSAIV